MTEVKPAELILICFMLLHGFVAALNCTNPTPKSLFDALEINLFPDKLARPVKSFSDTTNITITITVVGILGVNEKAQTLTTVLWQFLQWDIEGLSWDEKECGTTRISVPRELLWIPDVHITEIMDEDKSPKTPYVYLDNNGRVYDYKPIRVVSSCRLGIYTFPFDVQNCSLTFGSYLHFATDIRMIQAATSEEILEKSRNVLQTKGEWELIDIDVAPSTLAIEETQYSQIKYYISIRRRPTHYVVNLLVPSSLLITVDLFSFLLPPESVDRASFKMTLILGYTVFLLIMNDLLPITGESTPVINVFFCVTLALMVASLLETVFITKIQFSSSRNHAVPHWLRVVVLRYLAIVVCLPSQKKSNRVTVLLNPSGEPAMNSRFTNISESHLLSVIGDKTPLKTPPVPPDSALHELKKLSRDLMAIRLQMDKQFQGSDTAQEWQMVGIIIDRLLFSLYIIVITVSFLTLISIWIWNHVVNHHH
ncbi:5-hydroxytryptamine receptor 3A isoform X1 [Dicentrarchus labrax]|uniref:5-hydroxytryptamine receptor 3A isoform X1 n=1 Tax=Dicentrarchus labrax TaxID=13489 RepID=UPI0021F69AF4|nr:5-hydroxytryptamine receptor 3A isoform X1 [Dicentrarchus labrax]